MPLQVQTARFGRLEFADDRVLTILGGLVGLPHCTRFVIVDPPGAPSPLRWLQCVDDGAAAFVVVDPAAFWPEYQPEIPAGVCELLGLDDPRDAVVAALCVVPEDPRRSTANLAAPLVINPERRCGVQLILETGGYALRQPLFADDAAEVARCSS